MFRFLRIVSVLTILSLRRLHLLALQSIAPATRLTCAASSHSGRRTPQSASHRRRRCWSYMLHRNRRRRYWRRCPRLRTRPRSMRQGLSRRQTSRGRHSLEVFLGPLKIWMCLVYFVACFPSDEILGAQSDGSLDRGNTYFEWGLQKRAALWRSLRVRSSDLSPTFYPTGSVKNLVTDPAPKVS